MEEKILCQKLQYLVGVPSRYIDNFDDLNKGILKQIRKLCSLRTVILANFSAINTEFKNFKELRDISLVASYFTELDALGIVIDKARNLSMQVAGLNALIDERIEKISLGFKWIPPEWIQEIFHMPDGDTVEGVQAAKTRYRQFKNYYPYQRYINWPFAETPEEIRTKNIFGNDESLHEALAVIHRLKSIELYDFVGMADKIVLIVDCENSDAQRLYDTILPFKYRLNKIILVDDTHTNKMWDEMVREYQECGITIEHDELPRLKEQKSLVDHRMVAKTCEEYYKNHVEHFILVTSDSDVWALITSLPDADIMVLAERCKSGDVFIEALTQHSIKYVFMEDITEESTLLMDRIMRKEIEKQMSRSCIDVRRIVTTAAEKLNLYLDKETIDLYVSEALGEIVPVEDIGKGRIIVMPER